MRTLPAGSLLAPSSARLKSEIEKLGLRAVALAAAPDVANHAVTLPRLAVFSNWSGTQDVGWVRYALDQFEVHYDLIYKERIRQGDLKSAYDVIVVPSQGGRGGAKSLVFDIEPKGKPIAYDKTPQFKSLGMYGESPDITGGMGLPGVVELEKFVQQGGVLVTLGAASYFPPEFGLTRTVDAARPSAQLYAPGPIVEAEIMRPAHPIFYGYTDKTIPIRYAGGPLLRVPQDRPALGADAVSWHRKIRPQRPVPRGSGNSRSPGHRGCAHRPGPRGSVRHQPRLPLAEPGRIRHAGKHHPALERFPEA